MPKAAKLSGSEAVSAYIAQLDEAVKPIIEKLRQIILSTGAEIAEEIKWNAPSFYYTGEMKPFDRKEYKRHIIVMNLHKRILLVFPSGAKIDNSSGLLTGDYADGRKMLSITGMDDVLQKEQVLRNAVKDWISKVE
ncbi:DUF1801 domain-containing protein [Mucilaginibacter calamicampi]|uniref:DUF1801 domain-containing protein n=1 Tax=Mucilaginibacter calamicampi TaxID=1302352 RepID=A0ABW2YWT9_9SPHI